MTEKQFRERARSQLRQIGDQLKGMATDRDVYWRWEREIVENNPLLQGNRSAFLDMVRGCYVEAMTARLLRLLEPDEPSASFQNILGELGEYPELLHDKITGRELANDRSELQRAAANLRNASLPRAAHHERTLSALAPTNRALDRALDLMIATTKTYHWIVSNSFIDLDVSHDDDPLSIFQFVWAVPTLAR